MKEEKEPGDVAESKAQTKTTSGDTTGVYPNATGITEIAMGVTEDICTFKVPLNYVLLGLYYDENNEEQSIQGLDSTMTTMEEAMSEGGFSTGKHLACFSMASLEADGMKALAREMAAEQFAEMTRHKMPVFEMPNGDVLHVNYNRDRDSLDVGTMTNAGMTVKHHYPYDHNMTLDANLQGVNEQLNDLEEYREEQQEAEYSGGMRR